VYISELLVLLETTGHRLPITLQLLRSCGLPSARFFFPQHLSKKRDKITDDHPLQDVIGLSHCCLLFVIDLPLKAKSSTHLGALL
jgi:hypothetical protein